MKQRYSDLVKPPTLEKFMPPGGERVASREPISTTMSISELSKVLGRLGENQELIAELDGKRARTGQGYKWSDAEKGYKRGYWTSFEPLEVKFLQELRGERDVETLRFHHDLLKKAYPELDIKRTWTSEIRHGRLGEELPGGKWVFTGSVKVPGAMWRWDAYSAARAVLDLKPKRMEFVTYRFYVPGPMAKGGEVTIEELERELGMKLKLAGKPEYLE